MNKLRQVEISNMEKALGIFLYRERALVSFYRVLNFCNETMYDEICFAMDLKTGKIRPDEIMLIATDEEAFVGEEWWEGKTFWTNLNKRWLKFYKEWEAGEFDFNL